MDLLKYIYILLADILSRLLGRYSTYHPCVLCNYNQVLVKEIVVDDTKDEL